MNEEEKVEGGEGGAGKPVIDAFGVERTPDGKPVPAPEPAVVEKKEGEETKPTPEDLDKNPVVVALRDEVKKLTEDKNSMGGNLSAQNKAMDALKARIKDIEDGKKDANVEPMFKDIKHVKDLPQDEQDAMSDAEKRTFDQLADTREAMNKMIADAAAKEAEASKTAKTAEEAAEASEVFTKSVQAEALRLASNDKEVANAIITEFNEFADNDKLTPEQITARLEKAAKLVPDYKPPKEQAGPRGTAPKAGDAAGTEIDKIVEQVAAGKKPGASFSL